MDADSQLSGTYGDQSSLGPHTDPDDLISTLYARMLFAESTSRPTKVSWPAEVGLSPGCGSLAAPPRTAELYDYEADHNDVSSWNLFAGFFDGDCSSARLRAGDVSAGSWRLKQDVGLSTVVDGGSCDSDGATSPSYSPTESSSGSAA